MPIFTTITCRCCHLPQRVRDQDGPEPDLCDWCAKHQGQRLEVRAERAEAHADELHVRLAACRKSEEDYRLKCSQQGAAIASALESRNEARGLVDDIADLHGGLDDRCKCGLKNCKTRKLLREYHRWWA